jgi:cobalt-zinc-cadmium efflux system outer membrane protein
LSLVLLSTSACAAPISLDSVLAVVRARNPELRAAAREVEAARARVRQAGALEAPSLSYEVGKLGTPISSEERESSLRVSQSASLFGQRGRAVRVAQFEAEIAEAERASTLLRIEASARRAYRQLQADELTLHVLESLHGSSADLEEYSKIRMRAGAARLLDVLRARAERARIENDRLEALRSRREHEQTLRTLMARSGLEEITPADSLRALDLQDSLSALLAAAKSRPRLVAARLRVERERASLSLARSNFLPTTDLSLGIDRVPGSDMPGWGGGIGLSLPFAPWTDRRGRAGEAQAQLAAAESRLESSTQEVESAIRVAFVATEATRQQLATFETILLADAEDAIHSALQNYRSGQIDGLEMIETLRTYRTIQVEHIRSLLGYELARTDLLSAE